MADAQTLFVFLVQFQERASIYAYINLIMY